MSDLLTTSEAAVRLGVSSSTVARMVDSGRLAGFRAGSHRRIPASAVDRLVHREPVDRARRRFGILVAAALIRDPQTGLAIGRERMTRLRAEAAMSEVWLDQWDELLDAGDVDRIIDILVGAESERSGLRQTQPLAGLVDPEGRDASYTTGTARTGSSSIT